MNDTNETAAQYQGMNESDRAYCWHVADAVTAQGFTGEGAFRATVRLFTTRRGSGTAIGGLTFAQIVETVAAFM